MKKLFRNLALAIVVLALLVGSALAVNADSLRIQAAAVDPSGALELVVYGPNNRGISAYTLTLDGAELPIDALDSYESGTTWLYLVDTSSVSTNKGDEPIRNLLKELIGLVQPNDNAAILSTGDSIDNIELLENRNTLENLATSASLKQDTSKTTLNATINDALTFLESNNNVKAHPAIVVISSGETANEAGMTSSELLQNVRNSPVTIYTVAFVRNNTNTSALNNFGALARNSCGGFEIQENFQGGDAAVANIISQIRDNEAMFSSLRANPAAAKLNGQQLVLSLNDGNFHADTRISLTAEMQQIIQSAIEPEPEPEPDPDSGNMLEFETPEPEPTPKPGLMNIITSWQGIAAICAVALILIIVIILIVRKSRRKPAPEPQIENIPDDPKPSGIQITLTQVGTGRENCYGAELNDGDDFIVGREKRKCQLAFPDDSHVSSVHMKLHYENGEMRVEDLNSLNHTYVNDVLVSHPVTLHQRDVLKMGSLENATKLRITWGIKQ